MHAIVLLVHRKSYFDVFFSEVGQPRCCCKRFALFLTLNIHRRLVIHLEKHSVFVKPALFKAEAFYKLDNFFTFFIFGLTFIQLNACACHFIAF